MQAFKSFTGLAACAAGVVAVAAGVYYVRKCGEEKRRMKTLESIPVEKDPVQRVSLNADADHILYLESRVMELKQLLSEADDVSESKSMVLEQERQHFRALRSHCESISFSLSEAKERTEIAIERHAQVEQEKSILMDEVKKLRDSTEKLEKQLDETHKTHVNQVKVSEKSLVFNCPTSCKVNMKGDHKSESILDKKYDEMLRVVKEKDELMKTKMTQLRNLEKKAKAVEEKLIEAVTVCEEKSKESVRERQAYSILKEKYDKMQEVREEKEKILKACESKLRHLELREKNLDEMLFQVLRETDEKSKECAKEREAFNILNEKYVNILDVVKQKKEAIKGKKAQLRDLEKKAKAVEEKLLEAVTACEEKSEVVLTTSEKSTQNAPGANGEREHENFDLMYQEKAEDSRKEVMVKT